MIRSRLIAEECGVTSVEYVLIASLVAVTIVAGVSALGGRVAALFTAVKNGFP